MRMLDNVIDINYYAVAKARNSNLKHRPVGLGIMGFQDCLHLMRTPYASQDAAIEFADRSMEAVCYYAYWRVDRAGRGARPLLVVRAAACGTAASCRRTRSKLLARRARRLRRDRRVVGDGLDARCARASRSTGCATRTAWRSRRPRRSPTSSACAASIEPEYQNIYVKSNLSGEFTVVNEQLVADLKAIGLWDEVMVADLKYFDGSLAKIDRVPAEMRELYATAFEVDDQVDRRSRRAPPEVDRPGAEPEHLHGRRVGQEARRDVQARVGARTQDHVLPAHARGDVGREVDRQGRRALTQCRRRRHDRRVARSRHADQGELAREQATGRRDASRSLHVDDPTCEHVSTTHRAVGVAPTGDAVASD